MEPIVKFGIIVLLILVSLYFYVMGLCYLCDLYEEKKRKERLHRAIEETEMRRKSEIERRKNLAQARMQRRGSPPAGAKVQS